MLSDLTPDSVRVERYVHQAEEWGTRTHVVVPVDPSEVEQIADHCDFCYAGPGVIPWTVVTKPFTVEVYVPDEAPDGSPTFNRSVANYSSLWAACNDCATLIRRKRWSQLTSRVFREYEKRNASKTRDARTFLKEGLKVLYDRVEMNFVTVRASDPSDHITQTH